MQHDDHTYFRSRAEAELAAAEHSAHPGDAQAHYLLAGCYLNRAYDSDTDSSVFLQLSPHSPE